MRHKGIVYLLALIAAVSAGIAPLAASPGKGLEARIALSPGRGAERLGQDGRPLDPGAPAALPLAGAVPLVGDWLADGVAALPGAKGELAFVLSHAAYRPDGDTDLLLHFDSRGATPRDEAGNYAVEAGPAFAIEGPASLLGGGSASFRGPGSSLALVPGKGALLGKDARFRDFSLEFWLFPAVAENGEVILLWQSLRKLPGGVLPQRLSCVIAGGRVSWSLENFFERPDSGGAAATRIELRARGPLVPRAWSHHLLRFDGDTGLLEYLVDGVPEAAAHATSTGREGGSVFSPAIGATSSLAVAGDYSGLLDELRISRRWIEKPALRPLGRDPGLVLSPVIDLGFGNSRLLSAEARAMTPGASSVELYYRIADSWAAWRLDDPPWIPFRSGEALPDSARGRYLQFRAELYPDGGGRLGPSLSSIGLRYEPDPPPPPPARLAAEPRNGAIELRWSRVPESDLAGYLVYYGDAPGEYFGTGAAEGPSPIDAGAATSLLVSGIANGRLLYFAVAAYDSAALRGGSASRAGEFSTEVSARPSRTSR